MSYTRGAWLVILMLWAGLGCTTSGRGWVTSGFEEFTEGDFDAGGDNLYVSRGGRVQMIRVWDVNHDGHLDLFFGQSHDHQGQVPALIYPQRNGAPDPAAVIRLPTLKSAALCIDDLNGDGYRDVITLNSPPNGEPVQRSFIYWGGPLGYTPKYRTMIPTFSAHAAMTADLNGDGLKEIIVHNRERHSFGLTGSCLSVYWQTASGLFPLIKRHDVVVAAIRTADAHDLDGDGHTDVVFVGRQGDDEIDHVYMLRGQPGGLADAERLDLASVEPRSVQLVALDGAMCLVVLTQPSIDLYTWSGSELSMSTQVGQRDVSRIEVADVNGDHRDDLVCRRPGQVDCLLGHEDGFRADPDWSVTVGGGDIAAGDLTGDGRPDLAVTFYRQGNSFVTQSRVYRNTGSGFDIHHYISLETHGATQVQILDLDDDGREDVIFACAISGTASNDPPARVYLGGADGGFDRHVDLPAASAYGGFMADYDDDGFTDLLVTNEYDMSKADISGEAASYLYWGDRHGLSPDQVTKLPAEYVKIPLTADLDHDGYLDVVLGAASAPSVVYYGGPEGFDPGRRQAIDGCALQLADINRDGWLDLFIGAANAVELNLLWGSAEGFSTDRKTVLPVTPSHMEVADLDDDGWLDLIMASGGATKEGFAVAQRTSSIWWGGDDGFDAARRTDLELSGASREVAVADLNKDGELDLVFSNYRQGTRRIFDASILWGHADRAYTVDRATRLRQAASLGVQVADFNGDGWLDIAFCNHSNGPSHQTLSRVHWNRQGYFTDADVTLLPTMGPHNSIIADLGNAYTRKLEEAYTSRAFERPAEDRFRAISWQAETKFGTSVVFQVRTAATVEQLKSASWKGSRGQGSFFDRPGASLAMLPSEHRWIQYRAVLRTPNGGATPVLMRVEVSY